MKSIVAIALAGLILGGCFATNTLTPDGSDTYTFTQLQPTTMHVTAPSTNTGHNLRVVWWDRRAPALRDSQSCATWSSQTTAGEQEGAALRISGSRAITVTKNIYFGAVWIFNAHLWTGALPTLLGGIDLQDVFDPSHDPTRPLPLPWHLCARVVGARLDVIAWPSNGTQPAWGDATHGGSWTLPAGWIYPGTAGWYVGHLPPGTSADYTGLAAGPVPSGDHLRGWWPIRIPTPLAPSG